MFQIAGLFRHEFNMAIHRKGLWIAYGLIPQLLIVDEPTAGLDPEERIRFRNLLVRLATERTVILSTHIVEDIGQTCHDVAVLAQGQIIFRGSPVELTESAVGHVWTLNSNQPEKPDYKLTVVSMLHLAEGVQYRLVGEDANGYPSAEETRLGLEDGYVWLMKNSGYAVDAL